MRWIRLTNFKMILYYGTLLLLLRSVKSGDDSDKDSIQNFNSLNASCKLPSSSSTKTKICLTPECIDAASYLLSSMNKSVDPCEDFYHFSCGGWIETHIIPEDKSEVSVLSELDKKIENDMMLLLEEEMNASEADHVKKIKETYKSCMDLRGIKDAGYKPLEKCLDPIIEATYETKNNFKRWRIDKYDWMNTLRIIRKSGFSHNIPLTISVFGSHIEIDNPVIKFKELLDGSFFNESFDIQNSPQALSNREKIRKIGFRIRLNMNSTIGGLEMSKMNIMDAIFSLFTWTSLLPHGLQMAMKPCLLDALTPLDEKHFPVPFETYAKIMVCLNSLKNRTETDINKKNRRDNVYDRYKYSVKELQEIAPEIDWLKYFNILFDYPIYENETLVIPEINPIPYVAKFMKITNKSSILVYYEWQLAKEYDDIFKELTQKEKNRGKKCFGYIAKHLDIALGSFYIKKYFQKEKQKEVSQMVNYIKNVFYNIMETKTWIKDDHKEKVKKKIMDINVVQAECLKELLNDEVISKLYEDLEIETNYIYNHMRMKKLETDRKFSRIRKQNNGWKQFTGTMNSDVTFNLCNDGRNIPTGRLRSPYFDTNRPQYLNYGALGSVIGHDIAYAFNHTRSHKDENLEPWWGADIEEKYNYSRNCIIEQYRKYSEQMGLKPSNITIERDLADNLGLRLAYLAYNSWVKDHGTEAHLPGLQEYTPKQLFWISAASGMCGKYRKGSLDREKQTNRWFLRVLGSVSNKPEFAEDFKCRIGAKMNPEKKCQYW